MLEQEERRSGKIELGNETSPARTRNNGTASGINAAELESREKTLVHLIRDGKSMEVCSKFSRFRGVINIEDLGALAATGSGVQIIANGVNVEGQDTWIVGYARRREDVLEVGCRDGIFTVPWNDFLYCAQHIKSHIYLTFEREFVGSFLAILFNPITPKVQEIPAPVKTAPMKQILQDDGYHPITPKGQTKPVPVKKEGGYCPVLPKLKKTRKTSFSSHPVRPVGAV